MAVECVFHTVLLLIFVGKGVWQQQLVYQPVWTHYTKEIMCNGVRMFSVLYWFENYQGFMYVSMQLLDRYVLFYAKVTFLKNTGQMKHKIPIYSSVLPGSC